MTRSGLCVYADQAIAKFQLIQDNHNSGCVGCGGCGRAGQKLIETANTGDFSEGDRVQISVPAGRLIKMAFSLYILPFILFFVACSLFNKFFDSEAIEYISMGAFVLILAASLAVHGFLHRMGYFTVGITKCKR